MPKILILTSRKRVEQFYDLSQLPEDFTLIYAEHLQSDQEVIALAPDAEYVFADAIREVNADLIASLPGLKLIHSEGVGFNKIDLGAAKAHGVYVCNNAAANAKAVAEHTIMLMLGLQRRILEGDRLVRSGRQIEAKGTFISDGICELSSAHVGLIGLGAIAVETAKLLNAFGARVSYFSRSRKESIESEYGVQYLPIDELMGDCDIISLHLPVTKETIGFINKEKIDLMKTTAFLINTARGEIVVQEDLVDALKNGTIAGAGLDALYPEPVQLDNPLLNLPAGNEYKILFSPHTAGITKQAIEKMHSTVWANIMTVAKGYCPINIVNE